jgi:group I intron endonuclease
MQAYIYLITNLINGKVYVGKSVNTDERWRDHKKVALGGKEKYPDDFFYVHAAMAKYGIDNFKFEIIEEFATEDEAYFFETWWIQFLESFRRTHGYNLNQGGVGGIVPSEETRQKLIAAQNKPERIKQQSDAMKKRHQENPGFLGEINKGNKYALGLKHSEETKQQMSQSHKNNDWRGENVPTSKLTTDKVLGIRLRYENENITHRELAVIYGVSQGTVSDLLNRKTWKHI